MKSAKKYGRKKPVIRGAPILDRLPNWISETLERSKTIQDVVNALKEGSFLWKVRSFSKWYRRRYFLDTELLRICYDTSYKAPCLEGDLHVDLADMVDVRKGWKTDIFNKVGAKVEKRTKKNKGPPMVEEKTCFSIIYGRNKRTLDLVAANEVTCDNWVKGLTHLLTVMKSLEQEKDYETWLKNQFNEADIDKTGSLNFNECLKLLKQLNISMSERHARKLFEEANTNKREKNGDQVLDANEFVTFYYSLLKRPELEDLFQKYCQDKKKVMGPEDLLEFLTKEQKMHNATAEEARYTIETFEYSDLKKNCQLSLSGFVNMMLSEKYEIFNQDHRVVYQDMTQPLSHYYIASSHNTYLLGNQLSGTSSVEAYVSALKTGCRCVEVDCWDGDDGEPIVHHGHTLTSKILFKEVLSDALKLFAFETSEYPVILSMENHCGDEQQSKLAKYLSEVLGDMLYMNNKVEDLPQLPSPEDLKGKIIVKAKKMAPKPLVQLGDEVDGGADESDTDEEPEVTPVDYIDAEELQKKKKKPVSSILSDLVNICQAVKFKGFDFEKGKCFHMSSFSESKAQELIQTEGVKFVEYNKRQLCRIYPAGTRTSSSNYKPGPYWNAGCQIVALNYQTEDKPTFFNSSKFQQNGNCGYVLKPQAMIGEVPYDPLAPAPENHAKVLKVRVISGQQLPKPNQKVDGEVIDPYVQVKIRGHCEDHQKHRTNYIHDNGFNPMWNETFDIVVKMPETAMLYVVVKDNCNIGKDEIIGAYALPFTSIQEGYRHIYLKDFSGKYITPASLFVHISITDAY